MIKKSRKENKYLYNIFLTKNNRNTVNYNPHPETGHGAVADSDDQPPSPTTHSVFPSNSASTSFPRGVTHSFIPEGSVLFDILLGFGLL